MKNLLLIFSVLLSTSLSAVEYGYNSNDYDEIINLNEGDIFEIIYAYFDTGNYGNDDRLDIYNPDTSLNYHSSNTAQEGDILSREGSDLEVGATFVGPSKIKLNFSSTYQRRSYFSYKITRASELEYKNVNIVSLPSSSVGQGTHNIVVEASDDLQSWTPVHSSSIGGDKAFFRTRVVEAE